MNLDTPLKIEDIIKSPNVADLLDDDDLVQIGNHVHDSWMVDKTSREDWEEKTATSMKLALQVIEKKTFPWENASNVKFPIVTIAALQFQSRAYPALIPGNQVVKTRIFGGDDDGQQTARAQRVADYMSFQVLEEDETWEKNMDEVLISLAIVGCAFKKSYFDPSVGHNISEHILAKDLYIPYYAKSLERASRITQVLYFTKNDLFTKTRSGLFKELKTPAPPTSTQENELEIVTQESQGLIPALEDPAAPRELLEQHCWLDLDGDGYEEPYTITIDRESRQVLRIVARFVYSSIKKNSKKEITSIKAIQYYTKYTFIPSPDGGIYDLGLGVLLGALNESINTILNQLVDSGTLSNTAGGFLGRGVKFRSGDNSFRPFEWKRVDSTGDDLRKGIVPLEVREPSQVLFQLLSLLINYGERIGMATDPQVGVSPGQNTPAETSRNVIAEGQRVFNAIFKRIYRALKEEFKKLYQLNSVYLEDSTTYFNLTSGELKKVLRSDFAGDNNEVLPAADPNMITKEQKIIMAKVIQESAMASPGLYNKYEVEKRLLRAMETPDIEAILPDPKGENAIPEQPDPLVIIETMKIEQQKAEFQMNLQIKMFDLMQETELLRSEILEKETRAALNLAQAEGAQDNLQITALQSAIALAKTKQDGLIATLKVLKDLAGFSKEKKGIIDGIAGGVDRMEKAPDDSGVVQVSK